MRILVSTLAVVAALAAGPLTAQPLDTAFTYQGRLQDAGAPANGAYDFRLILYDAPVGGSQVGPLVLRDDVAVTSGLFSVSLDFGTSAFTGSRRWLEVAIRPGGSTGPYAPLSERQELQAAPHSTFSLHAPWTGITGKPAGFSDDTDDDALGGLTCANGQVVKWNGTAWACANDLDTNTGGTVTSVATGAGLTGGPITTIGTVSVATGGIATGMLADGAVTSPKIANGAVGLAQIDQSQVQARVTGTCPVGQYLRGIDPDGTAVCQPLAFTPNYITTLDSPANVVGLHTSIAIGSDGLPVISYFDASGSQLKVAHCANAACAPPGNTIRGVQSMSGPSGGRTSIAIGSDGFPVISHYVGVFVPPDSFLTHLKVAKCLDTACAAPPTVQVFAPEAGFGLHTSIAIGSDGFPVISYHNDYTSAGVLKVVKCGDASCTPGLAIISTVDNATQVGAFCSMAIGADGFPVISYYDQTNGNLKVAKCVNAACTGTSIVSPVDPAANNVGLYTSIAMGTDGLPIVSYHDATAQMLKVAKCTNAACSTAPMITEVDDPANAVGSFTAIAIDGDGLPVISYHDATAGTLRFVRCGNPACSSGSTFALVDDNNVGSHTAIAIAPDGLPIISYHDGNAGALKVAKCSTPTCR